MAVQTAGEIDISPALTWSEVKTSGFMVITGRSPIPAEGRLAALRCVEDLIPAPEGTLHRFTFPAIIPTMPTIDSVDRETFRQQVQEIIAAFPSHTFGGVIRVIRFRGDQIDDMWRVGVAPDGVTVVRQIASFSWVNAP